MANATEETLRRIEDATPATGPATSADATPVTIASDDAQFAALLLAMSQPRDFYAVTPHDSNAQTATKGLWVGGAGAITGRLADSTGDVLVSGIQAGSYVPGNWILIKASGTTATLITGYKG